ncbi:MAG: hypothetical protein WAO55_01500 [Candidatus Manganitrophaceae bacterium]
MKDPQVRVPITRDGKIALDRIFLYCGIFLKKIKTQGITKPWARKGGTPETFRLKVHIILAS